MNIFINNIMSNLPQSMNMEMNFEKKRQLVLENVIKMLTYRKLLNAKNQEENIKNILKAQSDDMIYSIKLDNPTLYYSSTDPKNIERFYIKIYNQRITNVNKSSPVGEFLMAHKNYPKIVVVSGMTASTVENIGAYPNSEIFAENDLLINKAEFHAVPEHYILTTEESQNLLDEYLAKNKHLPKIYNSDPMAKYLNAKIGQIIGIIRSSDTSCLSKNYRIVIKGNILK